MNISTKNRCPCGNKQVFSDCCEPFILRKTPPETPEQLMRSRYCAYVNQNADYLISTWHPDCHAQEFHEDILNSFKHTQ